MVEDRLNGLALMHIHQEIEPSIDEVINKLVIISKSQVGTKVVKASPTYCILFMREVCIVQIWVLFQVVVTSHKF